ncbi:MAG TPA: hypothetical protein VEH86_01850, partial [Candidatus Acidoferrum sp.]|nr:hypothetical protein [Candidatus Acidoferrum sp.]
MKIRPADMDYLSTNGYISVMQKDQYDQALVDVSNLTKMSEELQNESMEEMSAEDTLKKEERKTHSILFHFEGKEKKEAELQTAESQRNVVAKEKAELTQQVSKVNELIQKKSMTDRMVPYDGQYVSLTGLGVMTLNDLNVRNYRLSDTEFSDFAQERMETYSELRHIAERGSYYVSNIRTEFPNTDLSQLWSVAIGLAKIQGDQNQISQRFLLALAVLHHFGSTIENKMMAAEIMTSSRADPAQSQTNSDLQSLSETLAKLERQIRHEAKVPKQLSAGIAAIIMFARRHDGTYPIDGLVEFCKMTSSIESAAILSVMDVPVDQLASKFQSFRSLFDSWGYEKSEDTELASAYLAISDLGPDDVKTKMTIILAALKNYLEYPLVAGAILASIPTLEANETLDLLEKAYTLLGSYATGLERSELISLSVRMIHGIKNELVKKLDPTAKITNTPVQFTYFPSNLFFLYA